MGDIKNIKISKRSHELLKNHCEKEGLVLYKFLEKLIEENCIEPTDIYGDKL